MADEMVKTKPDPESKTEVKAPDTVGEIQRLSESTGHAILEEIRASRAENQSFFSTAPKPPAKKEESDGDKEKDACEEEEEEFSFNIFNLFG